jgi:hypothetical protein
MSGVGIDIAGSAFFAVSLRASRASAIARCVLSFSFRVLATGSPPTSSIS